jgi:hypothetical protein
MTLTPSPVLHRLTVDERAARIRAASRAAARRATTDDAAARRGRRAS